MRILSKLTGGVAALALVATATTPAAARGWGGWNGGYRHHDRGSDAGAVIGAIAAVGIIAAIASAASSSNKTRVVERRYDAPPPGDYGYYDNGAPRPRTDRYGDYDSRYDSRSTAPRYGDGFAGSEEDAAVDACAVAARDRASSGSNYAEIRGINGVTARGNGYEVTGQIEQRSSYRAGDGWSRNFRCSWTDGRVTAVTVD
ncbi:MAG: hypothetical protein J7498_14525 [Sphingobium sp.]|nr:hypothetical protein [Sphingobium sp.]